VAEGLVEELSGEALQQNFAQNKKWLKERGEKKSKWVSAFLF